MKIIKPFWIIALLIFLSCERSSELKFYTASTFCCDSEIRGYNLHKFFSKDSENIKVKVQKLFLTKDIQRELDLLKSYLLAEGTVDNRGFPLIVDELLKLGFSDDEIAAIMGRTPKSLC